MKQPEKKYWFPAKTYGIGWGLPTCWQGWLSILAIYALTIPLLIEYAHARGHPSAGYWVCFALLQSTMFGVMLLKGEPLRWRWGKQVERDDLK